MKATTAFTESVEETWKAFIQQKDDNARERLLIHYLPLVKFLAGRMKVTLPGSVEFDDLVGAGLVGLVNSIDNFNPERGFKFETFAVARIRGAILDGLRDVDWMPRSYRQKSRKLDQAVEKLFGSLGRVPKDEEVAEELGLEIDDYLHYIDDIGTASLVSLDVRISVGEDGDAGSFHDIIPDNSQPDPYTRTEHTDMQKAALQLIDELNEQDRAVVALYYYEELTFREIGEVLGLSESRVCQIHTRIISTLRARLHKLLE